MHYHLHAIAICNSSQIWVVSLTNYLFWSKDMLTIWNHLPTCPRHDLDLLQKVFCVTNLNVILLLDTTFLETLKLNMGKLSQHTSSLFVYSNQSWKKVNCDTYINLELSNNTQFLGCYILCLLFWQSSFNLALSFPCELCFVSTQ